MRLTRSTIITGVAVLVLVAAIPSVVRETLESGRIYLFSWEFLADIPARLTGPGRLRFILQPTVAILLDVVAQFLIFQQVHPGAALVVGPVLIATPYGLARGVANRVIRMIGRLTSP